MSNLRPEFLQKGDKISIIAPSGPLKKDSLDAVQAALEATGLVVEFGEYLWETTGYFSGSDDQRRQDLQWAIDDPDSKAILCARGGYGSTRMVDNIDFSAMKTKPKWLIGFSDITAIHLKLNKLGIQSIHGPMGTSFSRQGAQESVGELLDLIFGKISEVNAPLNKLNRSGVSEGELIGGNLALLSDSLGTSDELETENKILFVEDIGEPSYKIDRMFTHLLRSGKLNHLTGLVIGDFSEVDDSDWPGIILERVSNFDYPVAFNFPLGHEPHNMPLIVGSNYQLNVDHSGSSLSPI